ncbi:MAG TPA: septal ring lytic transglycosylase RlpA family protein [Xanthobacteraceae bacterium]|nr:septal ring lytic transglycosylase RlpA family protein [Xanthobacteraceae bacterium]HWW49285.1 septal ring lytic transglycosylase RlpA family protein [Xanthobacteraceae bacterium]
MLSTQTTARKRLSGSRAFLTLAATTVILTHGVSAGFANTKHPHRHHHHNAVKAKKVHTEKFRDSQASYSPSQHSGRSFSGIASFYGNESGSKTASGQRFNQNAMTAAHRTLPFGTRLKVTHAGRSVHVVINDRGPFIRGRVLDLSKGAAHAIGLTSRGIGRVVAEIQ